jgi:hypothetical protein
MKSQHRFLRQELLPEEAVPPGPMASALTPGLKVRREIDLLVSVVMQNSARRVKTQRALFFKESTLEPVSNLQTLYERHET